MEGFLGIDVSKGYADFKLINAKFEELEKVFQLDDTPIGHKSLDTWLEATIKQHKLSVVYSAVESTGGYENHWFAHLCDVSDRLPVKVARINPAFVKSSAVANNRLQVTDSLSATNIAAYLVRFGDNVDYTVRDNTYREFRSLHNHILLLKKQHTQTTNQAKQLLYDCFPFMQRYCRQGLPNWVLDLLYKYPTAEKLSRAKVETVAQIKFITPEKAREIIDLAKMCQTTRGQASDADLIKNLMKELKFMTRQIDNLKKVLENNCITDQTKLLTTIKGIAKYSAAAIMIEIEDINRFATPKKLAGYFGLYPTLKESGDKKLVSRMSKRGRSTIRGVLYNCARVAVQHDPNMHTICKRQLARGKTYEQAIGVVMHKLLRTVWGVLTSGKEYDYKIDQANRKIHALKPENTLSKEIEEKRRMQEFDEQAPISNIARKKRNAHLKSQSGNTESARDHSNARAMQT